MAKEYKSFLKGISLIPNTSTSENTLVGDLEVFNGKLNYCYGPTSSFVTTEDGAATLINKTIDTNQNTISINGLQINTTTGTGSVVFSDSPTIVTPVINQVNDLYTIKGVELIYAKGFENIIPMLSSDASNNMTFGSEGTLSVYTHNGSDLTIGAYGGGGFLPNSKINFRIDSISNIAGITYDGFYLDNTKDLTFKSATNKISLKASTIISDYNITLPSTGPGSNSALFYDGSSYIWKPLSFLKTKYDAIVGSTSDVTNGFANYSSINTALSASKRNILVLNSYFPGEAVVVNSSPCSIEGQYNATVSFISIQNNDISINNIRIQTFLGISSVVSGISCSNMVFESAASIIDNGLNSYIQGIQL